MISQKLTALLEPGHAEASEQAIDYLVAALTAGDEATRKQGYEMLDEALKEALYRSCLDYGSLAGGFTRPLLTVMMRTVEAWAARQQDSRP